MLVRGHSWEQGKQPPAAAESTCLQGLIEHLNFQGTERPLVPQVKLTEFCRLSWAYAEVCSWGKISS